MAQKIAFFIKDVERNSEAIEARKKQEERKEKEKKTRKTLKKAQNRTHKDPGAVFFCPVCLFFFYVPHVGVFCSVSVFLSRCVFLVPQPPFETSFLFFSSLFFLFFFFFFFLCVFCLFRPPDPLNWTSSAGPPLHRTPPPPFPRLPSPGLHFFALFFLRPLPFSLFFPLSSRHDSSPLTTCLGSFCETPAACRPPILAQNPETVWPKTVLAQTG